MKFLAGHDIRIVFFNGMPKENYNKTHRNSSVFS